MQIIDFLQIIILGFTDSLNPATIATIILLLPLVKEKTQVLFFILSTYVVYFIIGVIMFLGVDQFLKEFIDEILIERSSYIEIGKIVLGIALIGLSLFFVAKLIYRIVKKKVKTKSFMNIVFKSISPVGLIFLGIYSTALDVTTAFPYFGFQSLLTTIETGFITTLLLIGFYCFIYILPMIIIYLVFEQTEKFEKIKLNVMNFVNKASEYLIPVFLLCFGIFLLV